MQFSPLFLPMLNSSENSGSHNSFKLSNSTYLFADIMEVHIDTEMNKLNEVNNIDKPQIKSEDFLNFSISPDLKPNTNSLNASLENQIFTIDLESLAEQIEQMSYPLSGKELCEYSVDESENNEDKKFFSGVEINEIIKKISYLTGAINYNQFFSTDENFISVKNNKGEEVQLSVKEIVNIINDNKATIISLENDTQTLKIELTKKEFQNPNIEQDFIYFNENHDDDSESGLLKTEEKNSGKIFSDLENNGIVKNYIKTGYKTNNKVEEVLPGKATPESTQTSVNIENEELSKVKVDNNTKENFLGKQNSEASFTNIKSNTETKDLPKVKVDNIGETNTGKTSTLPKTIVENKDLLKVENKVKEIHSEKPFSESSLPKTKFNSGLEDLQKATSYSNSVNKKEDIKNQVYEVKLEVISKKVQPEQTENNFKITYKLTSEKDDISHNPKENKTGNKQIFINEIKDVIEEYPKIAKNYLKTFVQNKINLGSEKPVLSVSINNEKINEVEKVITHYANEDQQVSPEKESVNKNNIPVIKNINEKNVPGNKYHLNDDSKILNEPKNEIQPNNSESTNSTLNEQNIKTNLKNIAANLVSIESLNQKKPQADNKISEPEKTEIKLSANVEKESNLQQTKEELNHDQKQYQHSTGTAVDKIIGNKTPATFNSFSELKDSIRTISASEIVKEFTDLVGNSEKKSIVLRLVPENLGKIKISLDIIENNVRATFEVENESVKTIIQNNSENLKHALVQQGLQLNGLNISLSNFEQKTGKSFSSKRKTTNEEQLNEINEKESEGISRNLGYNTYEYLI